MGCSEDTTQDELIEELDRRQELIARYNAADERFWEVVRRLAPSGSESSKFDHPEVEIARCYRNAALSEMNGFGLVAADWKEHASAIKDGLPVNQPLLARNVSKRPQ